MSEESEDGHRFPLCPACTKVGKREIQEDDLLNFKSLNRSTDVEAYPQSEPDEYRHYPSEIVAGYDVEPPVTCSFPDHQRHKYGFLIKTACETIRRVGNVCMTRHIDGAEILKLRANEAKVLQIARSQLKSSPSEMRSQLDAIAPFLRDAEKFVSALKINLRGTHAEIARRRKLRGGERSEVRIDEDRRPTITFDADEQHTAEAKAFRNAASLVAVHVEQLVGHSILDPTLREETARALNREIAALERQLNEQAQGLERSAQTIRQLEKQRAEVAANLTALREVVDDARRFFSDENLKRWQIATKQRTGSDEGGLIQNGCYEINVGGRPCTLGIGGRFTVAGVRDSD